MKERPSDPRRLDLATLCRTGGTLQGEWPQADLARLCEGLLTWPGDGAPPAVAWSAQGLQRPVKGGDPELWLTLRARTTVMLQCQRCLQPMAEVLAFDRRLRFVADEAEAARLDEESEDDVLALPARLDLQALVEDELILALPLVPRHERCPQPLPVPDAGPAVDGAPPPHPFAALARLRPSSGADASPDGVPDVSPELGAGDERPG